jgi:hypothetical protein
MRRRDNVEIWHGGPVQTVRSARTLVVFHAGEGELASRLLRVAARAYAQVGAAWTRTWERKAVILVPRDQQEAERLVGGRDLSRVAAVALSSYVSANVRQVSGKRIVVNTTRLAGSDNTGLQLVVTHEMTHLATRSLGGGGPLLLVEGFAEWTALRPLGASLPATRPALAERVRAGRFDGTLPGDAEFYGRDGALAYDEGSAFCQWVSETYSVVKLRALYSAFARTRAPSRTELDRGFRQVLGVSRRTAERRWAAWVRAQFS